MRNFTGLKSGKLIRSAGYHGLILLLIALAVMILTRLAYAQEGTYSLTVEGKVQNKDGKPSAFTMVVLTTAAGETFETQTGIDGGFTLQANTSAAGGLLAVKSAFADDMTFGQMPLSWSAGGFGAKTLAADLKMDGQGEMEVNGGGSELPLPDTPGNDPMPGEPPSLPTVTPTVAVEVTPTAMPPVIPPEDTGGNTGLIIGLVVLGLAGLGLVIGGIVVWVKMSRGEFNG